MLKHRLFVNLPAMLANRSRPLIIVFLLMCFFLSGCTRNSKPTLWIYTSLYPHVVQDLDAKLQKAFPENEFKWYQSGSENVAAKLKAEFIAGKPQADIVMTSDPFWYEELKKEGRFLTNSYSIMRYPVMVLAYHAEAFSEADAPKGFADLTLPRFKNKVALGSPLESGTVFTTVALLSKKLGWDYFLKLRANGAISAGGNSAVLGRIERKERPVGIVLLENVLTTARKNPKVRAVYPKEGPILIPSPAAVLSTTRNPELAKKVFDFMFTAEAQSSVVLGDMYPVSPSFAGPADARPWKDVFSHAMTWSTAEFGLLFSEREQIKKKFAEILLE